MNDLTVDVFDAITYLWYIKDKDDNGFVKICVDDILFLRGLEQQKSGSGRRGGYSNDLRSRIVDELKLLSNIQIKASQLVTSSENKKRLIEEKESSLIIAKRIIEDSGDYLGICLEKPYYWHIKLGSVIQVKLENENLQTGMLNRKILEYDPYREEWEKRIGRYLLSLFRIRQKNASYSDPISIEAILQGAGIEVDYDRPKRTRERFDKAIDKLEEDGIIANYDYQDAYIGDKYSKKDWIKHWLNAKLIIEPPLEIVQHYSEKIKSFKREEPTKENNNETVSKIKALIGQPYEAFTITQGFISKRTGIPLYTLSRILSNKTKLKGNYKNKLEKFISEFASNNT